MAVLVEGISVIIRRRVIEEKFPGGWDAFVEDVPNETLCADDELARVGFMSPDDVKAYCKKLIDVVGKGGGFIMDSSTVIDDAKPENVKAMIDFTKEYGVYG